MKTLTNNDYILCRIQAELFSNCGVLIGYGSQEFVRRFMNSELAKRFDDTTILLEVSTTQSFIDEIDEQFNEIKIKSSQIEDKEKMYWLGYVYRYWCIKYKVPSKELYIKIKPNLILDRYYLYHSMDMDYLIQRIIEEDNLE